LTKADSGEGTDGLHNDDSRTVRCS
jgi:hypothetical protein